MQRRRRPWGRARASLGGASAPAVPPGTPDIWLDGADIDGFDNTTLINGDPITVWTNKGALGVSGDAFQLTPALQPQYSDNGGPGGGPCVLFASDVLTTPGIGTLAQPNLFGGVVWWNTAAVGNESWVDGNSTSTRNWVFKSTADVINVRAGTQVATALTPAIAQHNANTVKFDGASTIVDLNGAQETVSAGTQGFAGATVGAWYAANNLWLNGRVTEILYYNNPSGVTVDDIRDYFVARWGSFPQ